MWHDSTWQLYVATTVQGFGSGLVFSSLAGVVIASVPAHQTGVASGMNANIRTIGGSVGAAVMAGVVTAQHGPLGFPAESGYTVGFVAARRGHGRRGRARGSSPTSIGSPRLRLDDADNAELGYVPAAIRRRLTVRTRSARICASVQANRTHLPCENSRVWSDEYGDSGFSDWP